MEEKEKTEFLKLNEMYINFAREVEQLVNKSNKPLTINYLCKHSKLSHDQAKKMMSELIANGFSKAEQYDGKTVFKIDYNQVENLKEIVKYYNRQQEIIIEIIKKVEKKINYLTTKSE
jgi:polyhydroxyalkanoate synthesis regulator phasin